MARRTAEQALRDDLARAKAATDAAVKWRDAARHTLYEAKERLEEADAAVERAHDHVSRLALALEALTGDAVSDVPFPAEEVAAAMVTADKLASA